jgi:hypothetical protein
MAAAGAPAPCGVEAQSHVGRPHAFRTLAQIAPAPRASQAHRLRRTAPQPPVPLPVPPPGHDSEQCTQTKESVHSHVATSPPMAGENFRRKPCAADRDAGRGLVSVHRVALTSIDEAKRTRSGRCRIIRKPTEPGRYGRAVVRRGAPMCSVLSRLDEHPSDGSDPRRVTTLWRAKSSSNGARTPTQRSCSS